MASLAPTAAKHELQRQLPQSWRITTVRDVATLSSGTTPARSEHEKYFANGTVSWVKTGDLTNDQIRHTEERITQSAVDECNVRIYPTDTVLVAMYGGFRQIGRTGRLQIPAAVNQALCAVQVTDAELEPEFLQYWLNYRVMDWRRYAASSRKDPNITRTDVEQFLVPVPPRDVQREVIATHRCWHRAAVLMGKGIKARKKFLTGLLQQLLTGKRRFPEFVQSTETQHSRYFDLPADWKLVRVGKVACEVSDRNGATNGLPVLSCTKHDGLVESLKYFGRQVFSDDRSNYKVVRRGQFAYATNHIEEGSIGLLDSVDAGVISPMYTVFATKEDVHAPYLYLLFKTELYRHIFEANTNASVDRRGSLRWNEFKRLHIPLPPKPEQEKIAECIATCQREIDLLMQQRDVVQEQKKGLMQQLLTGKVRVPVEQKEVASA